MTKTVKELQETELDKANAGYLETLADVDISGVKASKPKRRKAVLIGDFGSD